MGVLCVVFSAVKGPLRGPSPAFTLPPNEHSHLSGLVFLPSTLPDHLNASHLCVADSTPFTVYLGRSLGASAGTLSGGFLVCLWLSVQSSLLFEPILEFDLIPWCFYLFILFI